MDLTTVARVKAVISSQAEAPANVDAELAALITTVSGMAQQYLNRQTLAAATTEYFDVADGQRVWRLKAFPVSTLTSVSFDPDGAFGADTALDADQYVSPTLSPRGVLVLRSALTCTNPVEASALKVVYTGGMATTAANFIASYPDIAGAIDLQVAATWHNRNALGMASAYLPGGGSMSPLPNFWIAPVKAVLDRERRVA